MGLRVLSFGCGYLIVKVIGVRVGFYRLRLWVLKFYGNDSVVYGVFMGLVFYVYYFIEFFYGFLRWWGLLEILFRGWCRNRGFRGV